MNLRQAIRYTIAMLLLVVLGFAIAEISTSNAHNVWEKLGLITFGQWMIVLGLALADYLLRAARWQIYLQTMKLWVPPLRSVFHYIGGFAFTLTPARVGELVRLHWVAESTGRKETDLLPLGLIDRVSDLIATGILLVTAIGFTSLGGGGAIVPVLFAFGIVYIATHPGFLRRSVEVTYRVIKRFPRAFASMRRSLGDIRIFMKARVLFPTTALGIIGWLAEAYALYLILDWLGAPLSFWLVLFIFKSALLGGGATGMPGGVGGIEAIMVGLLTLNDVPLDVALASTAIIRAATLWFAVVLGFMSFPLAQWSNKEKPDAVEV